MCDAHMSPDFENGLLEEAYISSLELQALIQAGALGIASESHVQQTVGEVLSDLLLLVAVLKYSAVHKLPSR